jgi:peptide/nickel transport system permease protein
MNSKFTKRFLKNKLAIFGAVVICVLIYIAIFGNMIAPDNTENANNQNISIKLKKPGFSAYLFNEDPITYPYFNHLNRFFGVQGNQSIVIDSFYYEGKRLFYRKANQPIWKKIHSNPKCKEVKYTTFYLGTDGLGRDVLSRLIIGARISMLVGLVAVIISLIIGSILGMFAGYYGGWVDKLILWLINVFWAIPTVLLAMALLMAYKGESQYQIFIVFLAVGLTMWVDTARIVRGLIIQLKERQFVEAARALSYPDFRIVFRHIFPNTFSTLIVITASNFASAILMESGLSYLGLGVQPPTPSWGSMLREYYMYIGTDVSYLAIFPGLCIMLAVFSFYILGNGLRDAGDVKGE